MVLRVEPATEADARRAVAIEDLAYASNPAGPCLFPGPHADDGGDDGPPPRVGKLIESLRADPSCRWVKVVDTDLPPGDEGRMIAFSAWYVWESPRPPSPPDTWGPGTNPEACEAFFGAMRERRNARFADKPFVCKFSFSPPFPPWAVDRLSVITRWPDLKLLHTHPDHQKRGAGSMLLRWGASEADRLGLESYLEASPEGKPLYAKCGFRELETLVTDFSAWGGPKEWETVLMTRPAQ